MSLHIVLKKYENTICSKKKQQEKELRKYSFW